LCLTEKLYIYYCFLNYFPPVLAYPFPSYLAQKKSCLCRQSNKVTSPSCSNSGAFPFLLTLLWGAVCSTFETADSCLVESLFSRRVHRRAWGQEVIALSTKIFHFQTTSISVEFVSPVVKHLRSCGLHFSTAFSYLPFLIL
jgi:hypothetical protein